MATALATVMLVVGCGTTAQAGTASNLIAANKLAANKLVANKLVANRIAAIGISPAIPAGDGAVADIVGIKLPDGTRLTR
jgi:hypothetical protein